MIPRADSFYVRATYTVGPRPDGDGYDVREMPKESGLTLPAARARASMLAEAGYTTIVGTDDTPFGAMAFEMGRGDRLPCYALALGGAS